MKALLEAAIDATNLGVFTLSGAAGCVGPDSAESKGAEFLAGVRDSLIEQVRHLHLDDESVSNTLDRMADRGDLHEIADGAVPIYTHDLWLTFVDLAAYREDPTELGFDGEDLLKGAQICLYMIADRLVWSLAEDMKQAWSDAEDEAAEQAEDASDV